MKFVDEFRDPEKVKQLSEAIHALVTKPWAIMEICGGQTHSIMRFGLDQLLPKWVELLHGPGCPVCVTPLEIIDQAIAIAKLDNVILCSYGDMLRVPGSSEDLLSAKAHGGDVRIVYSPMDALKIAQEFPTKEVVFFGIGFETTAPANAMAIFTAEKLKIKNFSVLVSHVLVPPAMDSILSSKSNRVQGFIAAGHVCTVMGYSQYIPLSEKYKVPIIVTGFEPTDLLEGIFLCLQQLENGVHKVENQYSRSVKKDGNTEAIKMIERIFCIDTMAWRGMGAIAESGLHIKNQYRDFDAKFRFPQSSCERPRNSMQSPDLVCKSGEILQGLIKPPRCPSFGTLCTPERPLGATMVSSEGACAAYYRYKKYDLLG
ncbi:MAG: hydrogenase formation protein HypD [Pseudobdellovibrionaceae bacterium]